MADDVISSHDRDHYDHEHNDHSNTPPQNSYDVAVAAPREIRDTKDNIADGGDEDDDGLGVRQVRFQEPSSSSSASTTHLSMTGSESGTPSGNSSPNSLGTDDDNNNNDHAIGAAAAAAAAAGEGAANANSDEKPVKNAEPVACLYKVGRELGSGTYSVVKEAKHIETDKWFAAKVLNKSLMRGSEHLVKNEIVVLKRVSRGHPNILTLVDYFETDSSLYLITELAKGGELFDRVLARGMFCESDAAQLMKQITSGVAHLHANGIVHRDLKPENLLFKTTSTSSNLLICDFGLSRIIDEENFRMLMTTVGTPAYMAPEIFTQQGHGKPVDIWALGVIAFFLLTGFNPFDRDSQTEEREAIVTGDLRFMPETIWMHITSDAQNFISQCLQVDPALRPTAEECLTLPFLTRKYRARSDIRPVSVESQSMFGKTIPSNLEGMAMNGAYSSSPEPDKRTPIFSAKWG